MKIFISPFRGGSTSVAVALHMVGFARADYSVNTKFGDARIPRIPMSKRTMALVSEMNNVMEFYDRFDEIPASVANEIRSLIGEDLIMCAESATVHDDYPLGHDEIHPYLKKIVFQDAKFIFIERPMYAYLESVRNHLTNNKLRHMYGHCRSLFCESSLGDFLTSRNYKKWKSRYLDLKRCFYHDVLIMDLEDGWAPLASFLGFEVPSMEFPWHNRSRQEHRNPCVKADCGHKKSYSERYDSEYCPVCNEWTEKACEGDCEFCFERPERPIISVED